MEQPRGRTYRITRSRTTKAPRDEYVNRDGLVEVITLDASSDLEALNKQAVELFIESTRPISDTSLSTAEQQFVLSQRRDELKQQCGGFKIRPAMFSGRACDSEGRLVEVQVQIVIPGVSSLRPKQKVPLEQKPQHVDDDEVVQLKLLQEEMSELS